MRRIVICGLVAKIHIKNDSTIIVQAKLLKMSLIMIIHDNLMPF